MTSLSASHGSLTATVGKTLLAGGLRVYFCLGIRLLFSICLLTHNIMIMFCICVGYTMHCVDDFFSSSQNGRPMTKRILFERRQLKSGETDVYKDNRPHL